MQGIRRWRCFRWGFLGLVCTALLILPLAVQAQREKHATPHMTRSSAGVRRATLARPRASTRRYTPRSRRQRLPSFQHSRHTYGRRPIRPGRNYDYRYSFRYRYYPFGYNLSIWYPVFCPGFCGAFGLWYGFPYYYPPYYGVYGPVYDYGYPRYRYDRRGPYRAVQTGEIWFDVKPADAFILLDGEPLGRAGDLNGWWRSMKVEVGEHKVQVQKPGYQPEERTVHVRIGERQRIKIRLRRITD